MDHSVTLTVAEHGRDEANGERMLEAFLATHGDADPVVEQNLAEGTLAITLAVDAHDAQEAFSAAQPMFVEGLRASGLPATRVVAVHSEAMTEEELRAEGQLQPA